MILVKDLHWLNLYKTLGELSSKIKLCILGYLFEAHSHIINICNIYF